MAALAPIQRDTLYPLQTFQDASGLGRAALAAARRNGLITRKVGNRKFVFGGDFISWLEEHGTVENAATA